MLTNQPDILYIGHGKRALGQESASGATQSGVLLGWAARSPVETAKGIEGRVPGLQLGLPISGVAPLAQSIEVEFRRLINQSTLIPLIPDLFCFYR